MELFLSFLEGLSITYRPKQGLIAMLIVLSVSAARPALAQQGPPVQAPEGQFIQAGPAMGGGIGLAVGLVNARTAYSSEVHLVANLEPLVGIADTQYRVVVLMGFSLRIFGIERMIGNAGYRGFDLDVGVRAGPGLSFSSGDSRIDRNQRFVLILEPVMRASRAFSSESAVFLEMGTARPWLRAGMWIPL